MVQVTPQETQAVSRFTLAMFFICRKDVVHSGDLSLLGEMPGESSPESHDVG